jgi:tRNA(Ile)-lysidine synthase
MLRGEESERDEAFCRDFCRTHEIPFVCKRADIAGISGGTALEETARRIRYELLEETAIEHGCTTISLAHNAGDNLETMLFHLCRGTGLAGLGGIPPMRSLGELFIVRPLLDCTREEILSYLAERNLSYVADSTNTDTQYTRNFIRHEIVPKMREINPQAEENARKTAEIAQNAVLHLTNEATAFLGEKKTSENADALRNLSPALLYSVLSELYKNAGGETLSAVQSAALIDLLYNKEKGHSVSLTGGISQNWMEKCSVFLTKANPRNYPFKREFRFKSAKIALKTAFLYMSEKIRHLPFWKTPFFPRAFRFPRTHSPHSTFVPAKTENPIALAA